MLLLRHGVFYRIYEELIALAPPLLSSSDEGRNTSPLSFATGLWSLLFLSLSHVSISSWFEINFQTMLTNIYFMMPDTTSSIKQQYNNKKS